MNVVFAKASGAMTTVFESVPSRSVFIADAEIVTLSRCVLPLNALSAIRDVTKFAERKLERLNSLAVAPGA